MSDESKAPEQPLQYEKPKTGLFKSLLRLSLGDSENQFIRDGNALLEQGNIQHAINAFKSALAEEPSSIPAMMGLGRCFRAKGGVNNAKVAIDYFHMALAENYVNLPIYEEIIDTYQKLGDTKRAALTRKSMQVARTLKSDPKNEVANNNMGTLQLSMGHYDAAIRSFQIAMKGGKNFLATFNLAKAFYMKGMKEKDKAEAKHCLKFSLGAINRLNLKEPRADVLLLQAKIYMHTGNLEKAKELCDQSYALDPSAKEVYATKRVIEEKLGNMGEAQAAFEGYQGMAKEEAKMKESASEEKKEQRKKTAFL